MYAKVGTLMGGSGSINGLLYHRGHAKDFDRWAQVTGDSDWKYENILKYFEKVEERLLEQVESDNFFGGLNSIWFEAGRELGYDIIDQKEPQKVGFSNSRMTSRNGMRTSTYTSYIQPIEQRRKTLTIYRYSYVSKVIVNPRTRIAKGVEYTRHNIPRVDFATKEVILSAGTFISPLILMRSGIGPLEVLKASRVTPISILPVGENYMDHPFIPVGPFYVDNPQYSWNVVVNLTSDDIHQYIKDRKGPLAGVPQGVAGAFLSSSRRHEQNESDWPDIQLYYTFTDGRFNKPNIISGKVLINGVTRGTVTLNTTTTALTRRKMLPVIDFNFFENDTDLDIAVEGIKNFLQVIETTEAFKKIGAHYGAEHDKNCQQFSFRSDDYWKCYILHTAVTYHPTSSCPMGKENGEMAVVDAKLRVIGVSRLRVVDASVMPYVTNCNTFGPVAMIAEKASELILETYEYHNAAKERATKTEL